MIEKIVRLGIRRPLLGIALVGASAIFGFFAFRTIPTDVFPDLSTPTFNLILQNSSYAPEEIETAITIPLETSLNGMQGVRRIRSQSAPGVSQITVEFEPDVDYKSARQQIAERVAQAASSLPEGVEAPLISSVSVRLNEIMELSLDAEPGKADFLTLRDLAEFDIFRRLSPISGVSAVERLGGHLREFQILLDPGRMLARGVTLQEILHSAQRSNANSSGGFLTRGETEWTVRTVGRIASVDDLRRTVVTRRGNIPVLLGDVADVREGSAIRRGIAHRTAGEIVSLRIIKQPGANTLDVTGAVTRAAAEISHSLPEGVHLLVDYDQGSVIQLSIFGLMKAILIGAVLVVAVIGLLLGDLRAAALVTFTIPLSIAMSGLLLKFSGAGVNAMTLGGLAIAVGLLVDAGIIICENVVHRLTENKDSDAPRGEIALRACLEMSRPIAFATAILIAVFGPLVALGGIEGKLYGPLALSVVGAVLASFVVSILLLPALASWFLRARPPHRHEDVLVIRAIRKLYEPALDFAMRHAAAVRILTLLITIPAFYLAFHIGSDFLPKLDEGAIMVNTSVSPGASLELVDRLNHRVEDEIRKFPEVREVNRRTGRSERTEDPMQHTYSDILVILRDDAARRGDVLADAMRERLRQIPGIRASFTTPLGMRIDEGLAGTPADISVKFFGPDLDTLQQLATQAETAMNGIRGLQDVRAEVLTGTPQIRISVDREECNKLGVEVADVTDAVAIGLAGAKVSEAWVGTRRYDIIVKLGDEARGDLVALRNLRVFTDHGGVVPISQLARIEESSGPNRLMREGGVRRIAVDATVAGRDLASAANEIKSQFKNNMRLPQGYFHTIGGKVESQERSQRALLFTMAFSGLLMILLLYFALDSFGEVMVILGTLPDAFVGGIVALWISGGTWNVSSLVGLVGLFGIAVQNGLVLMSQTKHFQSGGVPFHQALRQACISRVRPKLMTAATAILGLLPILLFNFRGTELERPLAVVMTGGLVTSTLFTLLALPTFYSWIYQMTHTRNAEEVSAPHEMGQVQAAR